MKTFLCLPFFTVCCVLLFSLVKGKEVISVYTTTNGSTVHVNQNFRHGQRIEVPLGKLTNDATREGVIQINSLLNFNHHVAIGDGAGSENGGNTDDSSGSRNANKISSSGNKSNLVGTSLSAKKEIEEPLPEYCKDKEQINRFVPLVTKLPHDDCPSGVEGKLLEGINRRRACARLPPLKLSPKLSTEASAEALRSLHSFARFKPVRSTVAHYVRSEWTNFASSRINERYFNLLASWDDHHRGRPYLSSLSRYFTAKEWAEVGEIGIGCAGVDLSASKDEEEDLDGDGVADPKRLPPYCAHEGEKLREISSNISVPVTACPADVLEQAIEGFAQQRVCSGLPRLVHTPEMAVLATRRDTPIAGQYTIGKEAPQEERVIDLAGLDIFSKWEEWNGLPWYVPGGNGGNDRYFTAEEWARTREFGVGCATYHYAPSKKNLFWLVAYFKYPN
ncbi:hypothetical protein TYRP_005446 [Tyrophagus putrescentiae]|nr:hypothetical protein TYRP_005446 [Tyrophagus putrescentiae]